MENKFEGTITSKEAKSTYWNIKLKIGVKDNGEDKVVALNTKDEGFWTGLKVGDSKEFTYDVSKFTGKDGKEVEMKWIRLDNQSPRPAQSIPDFGLYLKDINAKVDSILNILEEMNSPVGTKEDVTLEDLPF